MRISKKRILSKFPIILLSALILLSGCSGSQQHGESTNNTSGGTNNSVNDSANGTNNSTSNSTNNSTNSGVYNSVNSSAIDSAIANTAFFAYCAKEQTDENQIYFYYPQIKGETADDQQINGLIAEFVKASLSKIPRLNFSGDMRGYPEDWTWDSNSYTLMATKINYEITRYDSDYLSIVFNGLLDYKGAPHPTHYFDALTIDVKKCAVVKLTDLYYVDADFSLLLKKECGEQFRSFTDNDMAIRAIEERSDQAFIQENKNYNNSGICFYMTGSALGIKLSGIPFAMGDYFIFSIPYDELEFARIAGT